MPTYISALDHIESGFPPKEGEHLADYIMSVSDIDWQLLTIDLHKCPPGLLISAFFNAFLQRVYEEHPDKLEAARAIDWKLDYDFQKTNVKRWTKEFEPQAVA